MITRRGNPVLLRPGVSRDTIECLSELLEQAKKGDLVGIAFGAIMRHSNYSVHATGAARLNPTFTRGIVRALDDKLSDIVNQRQR
jgi:hypothetical protein